MKELFFLLIESMKEETVCYRRLALLARDQKELLIAGSVNVLPENIRLQEKQVFALTPIISRRKDALAQLAKISGFKKMDLAEALKKVPIDLENDFKTTLSDLVQAAKELASINDVSAKLLDNAVAFSKFTLKAVRDGGRKKSFSMAVASGDQKSSFVNRVV